MGQHTPGELVAMLDGWSTAEAVAWDRTAWATAHLLTAWSRKGKTVTAESLLGRPMTGARPEPTRGEMERRFAALWARVQERRRLEAGAA